MFIVFDIYAVDIFFFFQKSLLLRYSIYDNTVFEQTFLHRISPNQYAQNSVVIRRVS